jgi:hypothetical protein
MSSDYPGLPIMRRAYRGFRPLESQRSPAELQPKAHVSARVPALDGA